jgi:hypothetical protein
VKEFELFLEQSGKLLRKVLKPYFHSSRAVDAPFLKDLYIKAVHRNRITIESGECWLKYQDNRNSTAHDCGVQFAKETLALLPELFQMPRRNAPL